MRVHTHAHTHTSMHMYTHTHTHTHALHTHTHTHACTRTHTHIHAQAHTHTHTRTLINTHSSTHTHTHTHTHNSLTHSLTHAHTDAFIHLRCLFVCSCIAHTFSFHWNTELVNLMAWLDLMTWCCRAREEFMCHMKINVSEQSLQMEQAWTLVDSDGEEVSLLTANGFCWSYCFTSTDARLLIRNGDGGGREWRLDHEYHPKKTGETVDRRQNNGSVKECPLAIAQRLVHCAIAVSTAVLGRVTRTMSVALLLRNSPKRKKSNSRSPAPPPCSWSHLVPCKIGFCFSTKSLSVSPLCSSERLEWMCRSVSVMYWSFDGDDVFFLFHIV